MLRAKKIQNLVATQYATHADFCRIFEENMSGLYLLSFLLTGDQSTAEKCFVSGLEDSGKSSPVFAAWAESWARRMIIENAIRTLRPRDRGRDKDNETPSSTSQSEASPATTERAMISAVLALPVFDRFVFVMTVLERYSDQECSLLLDSSRSSVAAARVRALQAMGQSAEPRRGLAGVASEEKPQGDRPIALQLLRGPLGATA
jgi:DNA-directed RNA polymerase specialized sigma24 family protein